MSDLAVYLVGIATPYVALVIMLIAARRRRPGATITGNDERKRS